MTAIAALNSWVSILLPFLFLAVTGVSRASIGMSAIQFAVWVTVTLGLRALVGVGEPSMTLEQIWRENLSHVPIALVNGWLFLGPLWILAGLGLRHAPAEIRRTATLIPLYFAAVSIFGFWWDVRLLFGLYPLLLPLILSALFAPRETRLGGAPLLAL